MAEAECLLTLQNCQLRESVCTFTCLTKETKFSSNTPKKYGLAPPQVASDLLSQSCYHPPKR